MAASVHDVVDYIVVKVSEGRGGLSLLKLQKLLYYVQAWSLALNGRRAFDARFQAWVHGPVCRVVFDRFRDTHSLYDTVGAVNVREGFRMDSIPEELASHVSEVLDSYARFTGSQLEDMTHREEPWVKARGGLPAAERCEAEIDEDLMRSYYAKLLVDAEQEQDAAH
jgi:uncharacterized phage-associated protein